MNSSCISRRVEFQQRVRRAFVGLHKCVGHANHPQDKGHRPTPCSCRSWGFSTGSTVKDSSVDSVTRMVHRQLFLLVFSLSSFVFVVHCHALRKHVYKLGQTSKERKASTPNIQQKTVPSLTRSRSNRRVRMAMCFLMGERRRWRVDFVPNTPPPIWQFWIIGVYMWQPRAFENILQV